MNPLMIFGYPIWVSDEVYKVTQDETNFILGLPKLPKVGETDNSISSDGYILNHPELSNIRNFCDTQINKYFHELMEVHEQTEIYITQSWASYNSKGQNHHQHHHPNSIVSAVFYVTSDNTPLTIIRPEEDIFPLRFNYKNMNGWNYNECSISPSSGQMIIFPSKIKHYVGENTNETERVSIAMNTFVRGIMGTGVEKTELKL